MRGVDTKHVVTFDGRLLRSSEFVEA